MGIKKKLKKGDRKAVVIKKKKRVSHLDYGDDRWLSDGGYAHYRLTGEYPEDGIDEDFMIAAAIANRLD